MVISKESNADINNRKRREKYHRDLDYRQKCKDASINTYRNQNGVVFESCLVNLPNIAAMGTKRKTQFYHKVLNMVCFTTKELSEVLMCSNVVVHRQIKAGLLPPTIARAAVILRNINGLYALEQDVYLFHEVKAMVEILGEHQKNYKQYRASHKNVTDDIRKTISAIRHELYIGPVNEQKARLISGA